MSASTSGAMAIMWRARSSKPRISPAAWAAGRPICQAISSATVGALATKASTALFSNTWRSAIGTCFQASWARRAAPRAFSTSSGLASERSA